MKSGIGLALVAVLSATTVSARDLQQPNDVVMSGPTQARGIFATRVKGYHIGIEVSNEPFPVVRGRTDFPDGTQFLIFLRAPWMPDAAKRAASGRSICDRNECTPAFPVKSGGMPGQLASAAGASFVAGPFAWADRKPFSSGDYIVDVHLVRMPGEIALRDDDARLANLKMARQDIPVYSVAVHLHVPTNADAALAGTYRYVCTGGGRSSTVAIDEPHNKLEWAGRSYKIAQVEDCGRYGWRAERGGASFKFCTATKGYAEFEQNGVQFRCQLTPTAASNAGERTGTSTDEPLSGAELRAEAEKWYHETIHNPERMAVLECLGIDILPDPQPPGHPPTEAECHRILASKNIPESMRVPFGSLRSKPAGDDEPKGD